MRKKSELPQLEHLISDGVLPHVSHDWRIRPVIGVASATRVILRSVSSDSWGVLQSLHCLNCCLCIYIGGGGRGIGGLYINKYISIYFLSMYWGDGAYKSISIYLCLFII